MEPGIFSVTFDDLPIDDRKAARLTLLNIWRELLDSWAQSYINGSIDDLAFDEYQDSGSAFAKFTNNFLYDLEDRLNDEPKMWNWVFEEETGLAKGKKQSSVVALKMPESWVDGSRSRTVIAS